MKRRLRTVFFAYLAILIANIIENDASEGSQGSWKESVISVKESVTLETDLVDNATGKAIVSLCCHIGSFLRQNKCLQNAEEPEAILPTIYELDLQSTNVTASDEYFSFLVWNPCGEGNRYNLNPHKYEDDKWYLLSNGSIYRPLAEFEEERLLNYYQYCLTRILNYAYTEYVVFFCEEAYPSEESTVMYSYGMLASVPFLVTTYVVYWVLPELKNLHGLTLRGYVGCLSVAYILLGIVQLTPEEQLPYDGCVILGICTDSATSSASTSPLPSS